MAAVGPGGWARVRGWLREVTCAVLEWVREAFSCVLLERDTPMEHSTDQAYGFIHCDMSIPHLVPQYRPKVLPRRWML